MLYSFRRCKFCPQQKIREDSVQNSTIAIGLKFKTDILFNFLFPIERQRSPLGR